LALLTDRGLAIVPAKTEAGDVLCLLPHDEEFHFLVLRPFPEIATPEIDDKIKEAPYAQDTTGRALGLGFLQNISAAL
jgi:hypothetical protein